MSQTGPGTGGAAGAGHGARAGGYDRSIFGSSPSVPSHGAQSRAGAGGPTAPSAPRRRRRLSLQTQFLLFSAVVLLVVAAAVYLFLRPAEQVYVLDVYQYTHVRTRDFRDLLVTTGSIVPETVEIARASSAARVESIYVQVGDDVEAGTILMQLASDTLATNIAKAREDADAALLELEQARLKADGDVLAKEQELIAAERRLADAEAQLPYKEQLYELGGLSALELQEAKDDIERRRQEVANARQALLLVERQAELAVRQAEQKAHNAQRALEDLLKQQDELTVRASASGRVLDIAVREGQRVDASTELLRYADVTKQRVETAVTPQQAERLAVGTPAVLRISGRTVPAVTQFVAPQATTGTGGSSVAVTLALDEETATALLPYTELAIEFELGVRQGRPYLPRGPFVASGDSSFVYVVSADGRTAERRDVRYGAVDGSAIEIESGLAPGDRVVYSSYTAFRTYPVIELVPEGGRLVE